MKKVLLILLLLTNIFIKAGASEDIVQKIIKMTPEQISALVEYVKKRETAKKQKENSRWIRDKNGKPIAYKTLEPKDYYTYEEFFTLEGFKKSGRTGTYRKDPHIWVYTSEFAKRFGMPKKWIDDSLKGVEALAFRYEDSVAGVQCGYFSNLENCSRSISSIMDMYISESANLPWNTKERYGSLYGHKSLVFLQGTENDKSKSVSRGRVKYNKYSQIDSYMGFDRVLIYDNKYKDRGKSYFSQYYLTEFDRDVHKGLDYISGNVGGFGFYKSRDVSLEFYKFVFEKINENREAVDWKKMYKKVYHKIIIPDSFMKRIQQYHDEYFEKVRCESDCKKSVKNLGMA